MSDVPGAGWVGGALGLLTAIVYLFRSRADARAKEIEKDAAHLKYMQDQLDQHRFRADAQAVQLAQLQREAVQAEVQRAELAIKLEVAREDVAELARVEQELDAQRRQNAALARELAEVKRAAASAGGATITPLRPPKGGGPA